jgi:hypothetical protein
VRLPCKEIRAISRFDLEGDSCDVDDDNDGLLDIVETGVNNYCRSTAITSAGGLPRVDA